MNQGIFRGFLPKLSLVGELPARELAHALMTELCATRSTSLRLRLARLAMKRQSARPLAFKAWFGIGDVS